MRAPPYYFSFDVESVGLFGRAFAVGWVIVNRAGMEFEEGYLSFAPHMCTTDPDDAWVIKNVLPALPHVPDSEVDPAWRHVARAPWVGCSSDYEMWVRFWDAWTAAKKTYQGIVMVTDCPFPVEAGFLLNVVKEYRPQITMDASPYPIIDVASALVAVGRDPTEAYERLDVELPVHNPVCDARQSVRILQECLAAGT